MTGFFVTELNQRRRNLADHLAERERQIRLRQEAEQQVRILIETSPLAILTLDQSGRIVLANESARELFGFEDESLQGSDVAPYLPILYRMLQSSRSDANLRTNVESKAHRRNGEVFLAHVWLSTYHTSQGPGLAAVVWDASENLRDREGSGFDSMMATSRVLIGAISHEIRNLASAAAAAHARLARRIPRLQGNDQYHVLGTLIQGLEKIASSGLRAASDREAVVADLGTVLDEARIVIEPGLREAGISLIWEVRDGLPLVQADHHSLLAGLRQSGAQQHAGAGRPPRPRSAHLRCRGERPGGNPFPRFRPRRGPARRTLPPVSGGSAIHRTGPLHLSRDPPRPRRRPAVRVPKAAGSCFTVELWPVENQVEG